MMSGQAIHLKGLNGIRAIAAIAVVISHINLASVALGLPPAESIDLAGFGVTMFFALSGFLITYLLILEREKSDIDIKKFYVRRALRIWPLYFLFLIVAVLIAFNFSFSDIPGSIIYYFFLAANIPFVIGNIVGIIGHFWSIAVEEQFYLFWPWLVKYSDKAILKGLVGFTIFYFGLKIVFRYIEYQFGYSLPYLAIHVTRFDCMAIGGIGGVLFHQKKLFFYRFCSNRFSQIVAWGIIGLTAFNKFHVASIIDHEIFSVVTVVIIVNVSANHKTLIRLDNKIADFIGKISYGIYVIHPLIILFFTRYNKLLFQDPILHGIFIYAGIIGVTIFTSYLSYEFYEKKFIKLKDKFSVVKSSSIGISSAKIIS